MTGPYQVLLLAHSFVRILSDQLRFVAQSLMPQQGGVWQTVRSAHFPHFSTSGCWSLSSAHPSLLKHLQEKKNRERSDFG